MSDPFSWGKFFAGLVEPTAYFKTIASIVRIGIMIIILVLIFLAVMKAKDFFFPKKTTPTNIIITGQQGGQVRNTQDEKKQKFGLINLW